MATQFNQDILGEFQHDLPGHRDLPGPDLLSVGDDLLGREDESVAARVAELDGVSVGDALEKVRRRTIYFKAY